MYYSQNQHISDEDIDENIRKCKMELRKICIKHLKGHSTMEEVEREFSQTFFERYLKFIENHDLILCIDKANWREFISDYELWKKGDKLLCNPERKWLKYWHVEGERCGEEASINDINHFFKLMEMFNLSPEYYEPVPEGTVVPDKLAGYLNTDLIVGPDIWKNDGGLLSDGFQLGSVITLTDHYGLESTIRVTEHLAKEEEKHKYRRSSPDYIGVGCIEGYTTLREREIHIEIRNGRINYLISVIDNDDQKTYEDFPLWKGYHEHSDKRDRLFSQSIEGLIEKYMDETQKTL